MFHGSILVVAWCLSWLPGSKPLIPPSSISAFPTQSLQLDLCGARLLLPSLGKHSLGRIWGCQCHREKLKLAFSNACSWSSGAMPFLLSPDGHMLQGPTYGPPFPSPGEPLIKFPLPHIEASILSEAQQAGKSCPRTHLRHAS